MFLRRMWPTHLPWCQRQKSGLNLIKCFSFLEKEKKICIGFFFLVFIWNHTCVGEKSVFVEQFYMCSARCHPKAIKHAFYLNNHLRGEMWKSEFQNEPAPLIKIEENKIKSLKWKENECCWEWWEPPSGGSNHDCGTVELKVPWRLWCFYFVFFL